MRRDDPAAVAIVDAERRLGKNWRERLHGSHRLAIVGGQAVYCRTCGRLSGGVANATVRIEALAKRCTLNPKSGAITRTNLNKLSRGRHPQTGALMGDGVVRILPPGLGT